MRTIFGLAAFFVAAASLRGAGDWIEQGDSLDRKFKSAEALAAYQQALAEKPDDADLLRKISKQYVEMVLDAPNRREQARLAQLGYDTALQAKKLAPRDAEVRVTVAVSAGRLAFYSEPSKRLELSRVVQSEAAEAVQLKPRFALGWHVLGRWHYEIANLNPVLRVVAQTIYGRMPAGSNEEAIRYLAKAVELEPSNALFHAELGRAYLAAGRREEARRELEKSLTLPRRNRDDAGAQDRARMALRGL
jgi:tetratricopeptide (TPR) repeat protein